MRRIFPLVIVLACAGLVLADDKKDAPKKENKNDPEGTWVLGTSEVILTLKNGRVTWTSSRHAAPEGVRLEGDYGDRKTEVRAGEDDTFSFRFRVDGNEMRVKDLKGKGFEGLAKDLSGLYMKRP